MTEKKSIWPMAIAGSLLAAAGGLGVAAYIAVTHSDDLVRDDYYAAEVAHQDVIDARKRAAKLTPPLALQLKANTLRIQLGDTWADKVESPSLMAYRPDDAEQDFVATPTFTNGIAELSMRARPTGRWIFELSWTMDGAPHQLKQELWLQR